VKWLNKPFAERELEKINNKGVSGTGLKCRSLHLIKQIMSDLFKTCISLGVCLRPAVDVSIKINFSRRDAELAEKNKNNINVILSEVEGSWLCALY